MIAKPLTYREYTIRFRPDMHRWEAVHEENDDEFTAAILLETLQRIDAIWHAAEIDYLDLP